MKQKIIEKVPGYVKDLLLPELKELKSDVKEVRSEMKEVRIEMKEVKG
ncbi:MAG: hypothetical protein HY738_02860 [Bacteroidia bacterium]|nr:hypothetical protein [Bacteroidia bacterium]